MTKKILLTFMHTPQQSPINNHQRMSAQKDIETDSKNKDFARQLIQDGHTCVHLRFGPPFSFDWCTQIPCTGQTQGAPIPQKPQLTNEQKRVKDEEGKAFVQQLRQNGHTCVSIGESFPISYSWCFQTPCSNSGKQE